MSQNTQSILLGRVGNDEVEKSTRQDELPQYDAAGAGQPTKLRTVMHLERPHLERSHLKRSHLERPQLERSHLERLHLEDFMDMGHLN